MKKPSKPVRRLNAASARPVLTDREKLRTLTPRETEVLGWLIEGKRDAEIGTILGISENTVHKHVQRVLGKLDVETRTAAARLATAAGFKAVGGKR